MSQDEHPQGETRVSPSFSPGVYRHYKGPLYTALGLVHHHETRVLMVLYWSHEKKEINVRPYNEPIGDDADLWVDEVTLYDRKQVPVKKVPRFEFLMRETVDGVCGRIVSALGLLEDRKG